MLTKVHSDFVTSCVNADVLLVCQPAIWIDLMGHTIFKVIAKS